MPVLQRSDPVNVRADPISVLQIRHQIPSPGSRGMRECRPVHGSSSQVRPAKSSPAREPGLLRHSTRRAPAGDLEIGERDGAGHRHHVEHALDAVRLLDRRSCDADGGRRWIVIAAPIGRSPKFSSHVPEPNSIVGVFAWPLAATAAARSVVHCSVVAPTRVQSRHHPPDPRP